MSIRSDKSGSLPASLVGSPAATAAADNDAEKGATEASRNDTDGNAEQRSSGDSDGPSYPARLPLTLLMCGSCLAAFLVGLDQTVITTAIPQITDEFRSPNDVGWYGSAYLLSACAFQPVFGQVYRQFAVRPAYFVALAAFLVGSLLCALAPTSPALIVGRALAGYGCAGVLAGNLNMVALSAPLHQRPFHISMLGTTFGIGLICGPIIGGALTSRVSWRWCFWINLPAGALTILAILCFFHPQVTPREASFAQRLLRLDLVGSLGIVTAVVMLLLALQWGGVTYAWHSPTIIGLLVGAGMETLALVAWQHYRQDRALLPLRIVTQRTVAATIGSAFFQSGATFVPIFYLPYWFQVVQDDSPLASGVSMIPWMVANFLAATLTSLIVTRTGYFNPPVLLGTAIGALGAGLLTTLYADSAPGRWIGFSILNAAGLGAARQQYFLAVQAVLAPTDIPVAISFVLFAQNLAGAIFVSVGNALIRNRVAASLARLHLAVDPAAILAAGATAIRQLVAPPQQAALIQLFDEALRDAFLLAIPLALCALVCALPMEWKNIRRARK